MLIPQTYWQSKGMSRGGKKNYQDPYKWLPSTVNKILSNQEYCGDIINFRTYSKSFKDKRRIPNDRKNWMIFKNVNEAIIDRETFEAVQKKISSTKRRAPKKENGEKSMFCDLLYCADCHHKLWAHVNPRNKDIHYFCCSNSKVDYRGSCGPGRHYIRTDAIEQVVTAELKMMAEFLLNDEDEFAELLYEKTSADTVAEKKYLESELQKAISRNETVSRLYMKTFEKNESGEISDEWFMELSHKYEVERLELKNKFVGYIEIPDRFTHENYVADTRQGVAVEYIPKALHEKEPA